jgi:hypothetical protein
VTLPRSLATLVWNPLANAVSPRKLNDHGDGELQHRKISGGSTEPVFISQEPMKEIQFPGPSARIHRSSALQSDSCRRATVGIFLQREGAAPEFCLMRTEQSPSLIAFRGTCMGENLLLHHAEPRS